MNKVITIHLNGNAYQLEESGYERMRDYLDDAARKLVGNPDRDEILADIEQAIADKCRAVLSVHHTVVLTKEVAAILDEMGPVDDGSANEPKSPEGDRQTGADAGPENESTTRTTRLYRLKDGAMIAGICNGLAAYFGLDVSLVRLLFLTLTFLSLGTFASLYFVLLFVIPQAQTTAEKAAAHGQPSTAQEFIRRAQAGYYEGLKSFPDRHARREWKRKFRHDMRAWGQSFRQEIRDGAPCGQSGWAGAGGGGGPVGPMAFVFLPVLALIKAILFFACALAILSLIATGAVLGVPLPGGLPVWAGVILLILVYKVAVAPLKGLRRAFYLRGSWGPWIIHPLFGLWHTVLTLAVLAGLIWLADRFIPHLHEAIVALPAMLQQVGTAIQHWWSGK